VSRLSQEDKLAIALHDFASVNAEDFTPFDYCDGPNGVRGYQGATAFPSTLALAASFDRDFAHTYGVALSREVLNAGKNAILAPGLDIARCRRPVASAKVWVRTRCSPVRSAVRSVPASGLKACSRSPSATLRTTSCGRVPAGQLRSAIGSDRRASLRAHAA
jgi:hypothetical protein